MVEYYSVIKKEWSPIMCHSMDVMEAGWSREGSWLHAGWHSKLEPRGSESRVHWRQRENTDTECLGDLERKVSLVWAWGSSWDLKEFLLRMTRWCKYLLTHLVTKTGVEVSFRSHLALEPGISMSHWSRNHPARLLLRSCVLCWETPKLSLKPWPLPLSVV